jgi:hypothetical protein
VRLRRWAWRAAAAATLLALAAASVPGWYWWQWRKEQPAIEELRRLGARVETERVEPVGLGKYLPVRWAFLQDRVRLVRLEGRTPGEVARVDLGTLAYVEEVSLRDCQLTDAALAPFKGLTRVRVIDLWKNPVEGPGLSNLSECRQLKDLGLNRTRVDDAWLAGIGGFPAIERLSLSGARVTDAGLAHLEGLKSLKDLHVASTAVTAKGLRKLRTIASLRNVVAFEIPINAREEVQLQRLMPNVRFFH